MSQLQKVQQKIKCHMYHCIVPLRCHNTLWLVIVAICEHTGMSSKWVNDPGKGVPGILTLSCTRNFPVVTPDETT